MFTKHTTVSVRLGVSVMLALIIIAQFLANPTSVRASSIDLNNLSVLPENNPSEFTRFVDGVKDGRAGVLRGVYVQSTLALPVVQQPTGYASYVSTTDGVATQFMMAAEVGNVGLLAHNYLSGRSFANISIGQEVRLVYGDGTVETFTVTKILRYQALTPLSTYSEFRNLDTKKTISADELFRLVYRGSRHVTFQTCIEANNNNSWGRLFIIAEPKASPK